ncbi:MAG: hypothetical protein ABII22_05830 [Candidatus Micrarchaeota archaeon]
MTRTDEITYGRMNTSSINRDNVAFIFNELNFADYHTSSAYRILSSFINEDSTHFIRVHYVLVKEYCGSSSLSLLKEEYTIAKKSGFVIRSYVDLNRSISIKNPEGCLDSIN